MGEKVIHLQPPGSKEIMPEINYLGDLLSKNTKIIQIGPVIAEIWGFEIWGEREICQKVQKVISQQPLNGFG